MHVFHPPQSVNGLPPENTFYVADSANMTVADGFLIPTYHPYLFPDRPHENTASLRPTAMLVKESRCELPRPRLARSKPTQVSLRYAHTVGKLPYGVVVESKLSVRHIHTERAVCAESYNRAVVVDFQVHAYWGDVVLCNLTLVHEAFHCRPYSDGFAVNHSLNFVHNNFVQTLL